MRVLRPTKRRHWIALGIATQMLVILFLCSGFFVWSELNCRHEDVDINTGRVRHTRYLLYMLVADRIDETWLSREINKPDAVPEWKHVNTFSPWVSHSPHHSFHGAIHTIRTLELIDKTIPFQLAARRAVAESLIEMWKKSGSYFDAAKYIDLVADVAMSLNAKGVRQVEASDIPAAPVIEWGR